MECERLSMSCQLDRIADAMTGFDWNTFVATLIATIVGALVASSIGMAVARAERPQPYFRADAITPIGHWAVVNGHVHVMVDISNVGDGPAYDVEVLTSGTAKRAEPSRVAKLESGHSLRTSIWVPTTGDLATDPRTLQALDTRRVLWPTRAQAQLTWQQPPRRKFRRSQRLSIADPFVGTKWMGRSTTL